MTTNGINFLLTQIIIRISNTSINVAHACILGMLDERRDQMKFLSLLILSCMAIFATTAFADSHDMGATVVDDFGCGLLAADSGLPVDLFTYDSHSVVNSAGNTTLKCYFPFDPVLCPSDRAIVTKDFTCGTFLGFADKSRTTTDCENGIAVLTCMVKHDD
jgi:hypothetical protein